MMVFFLALLTNFFSLLLVARRHKKNLMGVFKNPAFLLGDFFLIPLYFSLVVTYLARNSVLVIDFRQSLLFVVLAAILVLLTGKGFGLLKWEWFFHGLVAWTVIFTFLLATIFAFKTANYLSLIGLGAILTAHQVLGIAFPKKL